MSRYSSGSPKCLNAAISAEGDTLSKAFAQSKNSSDNWSALDAHVESMSRCVIKIASVVQQPFLNPNWVFRSLCSQPLLF